MEARRREPYEEDRLTGRTEIERTEPRIDRTEPRLVERPGPLAADVLRDRDIVRWGSVWGGTIAAFGILAILGALGAAIGLATTNVTVGADGLGLGATIWGAVIVAIALFIGGYVAGRFNMVGGAISGLAHSFLAWSTLIAFGAVLAGFGLTAGIVVLGGLGGMTAPGGPGLLPGGDASSWAPFALMLVGLLAALCGGYVGGTQLRGRPDFRL